MRIAGEFTSAEWPALSTRLESNDQVAWHRAIDILRSRVAGRYLNHARRLLSRRYSGFAVLAIDCAVIEALQQFRHGMNETPPRKSKEYFRNYLTETRLGRHFDAQAADLFYETIRCGILHQGETKEDSLVKNTGAQFVVNRSKTTKGIVINAKRFHAELEAAFEDYVSELLGGNSTLRRAFINKMNHISRQDADFVNVL